ncbi:uncharacterized protein [Eurosta solidaginis]|uniref:uncharacterized protein isoform X1 n=1 Tax=Eurosta solidaginis TaxID=178769 RepID=UPI00353115D0
MENSASTLLIKNIPKSIKNIANLLPTTPKELKPFGRRRLLLIYESETEAQNVLEQLQQLEVAPGMRLKVAFFRKNKKSQPNTANKVMSANKTTQTNLHRAGDTAAPQITEYVSKLYACDAKLNFNQPPPPYLKYAYPRITPDILDAISIVLMSNTRFYTQVLHLMNRMNLEPPFGAKPAGVRVTKGYPQEVATQTVLSGEEMQNVLVERSDTVQEKSESELESSEDDERNARQTKPEVTSKRKAADDLEEQLKKKARQLLKSTLRDQKRPVVAPTEASTMRDDEHNTFTQSAFEQPQPAIGKTRKIALNLQPQKPKKHLKTFVPPDDLNAERLTVKQLQELPIYKNYQRGEPSNKLYIKNLSKDVSDDDLKLLYIRFAPAECLEIKVMQQGRMKGQAFVTFNGLSEVDTLSAVAKALEETNGFLLRQKPMVVCYGKK